MPSILRSGSIFLRGVCLLHIVHEYLYEFTPTRGASMLPTLKAHSDYVHVSKRYKDGKHCKIGDCIVLAKPTDPSHRVCKRITGMSGDIILIDPSLCSSNNPNAITDKEFCFDSFIKVPKGHVWVTGDNLSMSVDSRTYNVVPMGLIKGKVYAANDFGEGTWRNLFGFRFIRNSCQIEDPGES